LLNNLDGQHLYSGSPAFKAMLRLGVPTDEQLEYFYQGSEGARMEEGPQLFEMADRGINMLRNSSWDPGMWIPGYDDCEDVLKPVRNCVEDTQKYLEAIFSNCSPKGCKGGLGMDKVTPIEDLNEDCLPRITPIGSGINWNHFVNSVNDKAGYSKYVITEDGMITMGFLPCEPCQNRAKKLEGSYNQYGNENILQTLVSEGNVAIDYYRDLWSLGIPDNPMLHYLNDESVQDFGNDFENDQKNINISDLVDVLGHTGDYNYFHQGVLVRRFPEYLYVTTCYDEDYITQRQILLLYNLMLSRPDYVDVYRPKPGLNIDHGFINNARYISVTLRFNKLMNGGFNPW